MRSVQKEVMRVLEAGDFAALEELAGRSGMVPTILMQLLFEPDSLLHWRAAEGLGELARKYPRKVEKLISRLLWTLNEDSGSFGWGAGAALGEIGRGNFALVAHIIEMLFAFLDLEFSRPGMLWGLGRLALAHPDVVRHGVHKIVALLTDPDAQVRAYAVWCLGTLMEKPAAGEVERLLADAAPVSLYDAGELRETTVGQLAREALEKMQQGV